MKKIVATALVIAMIFSLGMTVSVAAGTWHCTQYGYWYQNEDGSYPRSAWQKIDGKWYHFDSYGLVQTGLLFDGGKVYYIDPATATVVTGWVNYNGYWYYFDKTTGALIINTTATIDNKTYVFDSYGRCIKEITSSSSTASSSTYTLQSILQYLTALISQGSLSNVSGPHISSINDIITNIYVNVQGNQ